MDSITGNIATVQSSRPIQTSTSPKRAETTNSVLPKPNRVDNLEISKTAQVFQQSNSATVAPSATNNEASNPTPINSSISPTLQQLPTREPSRLPGREPANSDTVLATPSQDLFATIGEGTSRSAEVDSSQLESYQEQYQSNQQKNINEPNFYERVADAYRDQESGSQLI